MGLHVIIGYPGKSRDNPAVVYCGTSASEATAAREANTTAHHFEILSNPPSYRKPNSRFVEPAAPVEVPAAPPSDPSVPSVLSDAEPASGPADAPAPSPPHLAGKHRKHHH